MLSYEELLDADLTLLQAAVDDWRQVPRNLSGAGGVGDDFEKNVAKGLQTSDWTGAAADAAQPILVQIRTQIAAAANEAHDVHQLLDDALHRFTAAQKTLKTVDAEVHDPGSSVRFDTGHRVVLKDPGTTAKADPDAARYIDAAIAELNQRIQQALHDATEADDALYWALNQDPNGDDAGFDADAFSSITAAEKGREKALRDANTAAKLAQQGAHLTDAQIRQLDTLLAEHHGDPDFSAAFATHLGAKGTLRFWAGVNDPNLRGIDDPDDLTSLQRDLSLTLASATHDHSPAMARWQNDMVGLGNIQFSDNRGSSPWGFQVMSSLMHVGDYDSAFLQKYGNALMTTDKGMSTPLSNWESIQNASRLNYLGGSPYNPVEGFLDALDHNPSASTTFFNSGDHLAYLTQTRNWPEDSGTTALGHALMAGVTGRTYGVPSPVAFPTHTDAESTLMRSVVNQFGKSTTIPDGLAQPLGRMTAEYMPDVHRGFTGRINDNFFLAGDSKPWKPVNTDRFLYAMAQNPQSYAAVSLGEASYTTGLLDHYMRHPEASDMHSMTDVIRNAVSAGSGVQEVLEKGRSYSLVQHAVDGDSHFNKALTYAGEWAKAGTAVGSEMAAGALLPELPMEPIAGKIGETASGDIIDIFTNQMNQDSTDETTYENGVAMSHDQSAYQSSIIQAVTKANTRSSGLSHGDIVSAVNEAMATGRSSGNTGNSDYIHPDKPPTP